MRVIFIAVLMLVLCTGCWDLKEINSLAIISLAGVDKDPESGDLLAYYQVINPTGLSTRQSAATKAAVYTFHFRDFSHGRFTEQTGTSMPRRFFTAHLQSYLISERYAREGILDLINFIELNPERRSSLIVFITDSPMHTVMNSFTPLDRVPGRFIRALSNQYKPNFSMSVYPIRFKDLAKDINLHTPTILPIIHYHGEKPSSNSDRVEEIDASEDGISFKVGAVLIHSRMVGRIDEQSKILFFIMNKKYRELTETVEIKGKHVDVTAKNLNVKRKWIKPASELSFQITGDLKILNNQQTSKMTVQNLHLIEEAFNRKLEERVLALDQMGKTKGWDMLGIQDNGGNEKTWRQTKVTIKVSSRMTTTGNTSTPYLEE
ncbi:Ger(x)C family spore germination C-terminal domain-containing protein [Paenibacillus sepulcri]|uniref:Ger(X)C family spore germination protein n=1 Tax=Paenibacillus sepulcri TaxID=359917 RepID=A0ABS7C3J8_9BACL|nr:hypothetical protein [Paenibacillus sepulcri]